ncbi:MAG: helix-turn-helix domain-containing protein [Christensenellaceae bacterium]
MFGKRLKESRQAKGWTQAELAEKLSTTQSTIGKYEREELQPNIESIVRICQLLEVSADYLLGLEDDEKLF